MQQKLREMNHSRLAGLGVAIVAFATYLSTLAQGLILGDPTEYTIVSHILGIAHPPGYAFMTVLGKLAQTLIPFGTIAWRSHFVNACVGTLAIIAVYNILLILGAKREKPVRIAAAVFGALSVAWAPNHWQHSIHANPHLVTATFLIVNVWLLLKWQQEKDSGSNRSILLFSFLTGLGAVHHPLTVFSFLGYTLFILVVYPKIIMDWKLLLKMIGCALLGLSLFIYYPIISSTEPAMGPHTMNTLNGFLDHVLARGLSDALPYYSIAEQPIRTVVYWSILRLQYGLIGGFLAILGGISLIRQQALRKPAALLWVTFLTNYAFVISLKQQDIMAYIMGPNLIAAVFVGCAILAIGTWLQKSNISSPSNWIPVAGLFALVPLWSLSSALPYISLRDFSEGTDHVTHTFEFFEGQGEEIVFLNNWEFMTPLWYTQLVDGRWPDPADVQPTFVSVADPWLPSVFNYLPGGPVYLNAYKREIVDAGFRLRPRGPFYQVVEPGDTSVPDELVAIDYAPGPNWPKLIGYELEQSAESGDYIRLILAMELDEQTADFFVPSIRITGSDTELHLPFTTDSHLTTPLWQPNEKIIERFDFALPHDFPAGEYAVSFEFINLSNGGETSSSTSLGTLNIEPNRGYEPNTSNLLANFRHRVGLTRLTARSGVQIRQAPWDNPISAQAGEVVIITPRWQALDSAEESYTIFVHLIDGSNQSYANLDYTPLGGATPTHLWFPKWLPGQTMSDPYRLVIPENLPPGQYQIEVGLYEMISQRRLAMHDVDGNQVGDRYIAGSIIVE